MTKGEVTGFATWGKAVGLLVTFISVRAAFEALRPKETSEHVLLLRSINKKLSKVTQEEQIADLDYYDLI